MSGKQKFFKWTVEFQVDETWVADGFELTDERALEMLQNDLTYAYGHELKAKVISAPDKEAIRKAQGYRFPDDEPITESEVMNKR